MWAVLSVHGVCKGLYIGYIFTGNAHEEKEYSSSDYSEDNSYKKEENALNSEIKEEIYEEDDRNEEDSGNKIENQIDVENNDNQEQGTPPSSV